MPPMSNPGNPVGRSGWGEVFAPAPTQAGQTEQPNASMVIPNEILQLMLSQSLQEEEDFKVSGKPSRGFMDLLNSHNPPSFEETYSKILQNSR